MDEFKDHVGMFKVGKQLFTLCGPKIVEFIKSRNAGVFLDLKYHDIPNTVSKAAVEAAKLHVDMFNVHVAGGFTMMEQTFQAISEAATKLAIHRPKIIAVTVLTSIDDEELKRMGFPCPRRLDQAPRPSHERSGPGRRGCRRRGNRADSRSVR